MASVSSSFARSSRLRAFASRFPIWMRLLAGALLVAGLAVGAYYQFKLRPEARQRQRTSELWVGFDRAAKAGDEEELLETLDELLQLNPGDALAIQRKRALETGSADESDTAMPGLTLPKHLKAGRWPEAEREAAKRLVHQPKDWLARCTLAKAALLRGDRPNAGAEIDRLPDPKDSAASITPASLLFAFDLFRELDRDAAHLRQFVRDVVIESARASAADGFPTAFKAQLVECYLEGFEPTSDRPQPSGLSRGILAIGRHIDSSLADPALETATLMKLGLSCNRLAPAFALLRREGQITGEQYPTIAAEHDARSTRVWQAAVARDPKAAPAYHGLAITALRANDGAEARRQVVLGLEACGDHPQLLALYSLLLRTDEDIAPLLNRLSKAAELDPKNVSLWLLVAETAEAAGRRDLALDACAKARAVDAKNPWALRTEARIYIESGGAHTQTGIERLAALGEALPGDPLAARLYVRGLTEAGLDPPLEAFLDRVEAASAKQGSSKAIGQALRGIADGPFRPALAELAIRKSKGQLERYTGDAELLTVQALAYFQSAERAEPRWADSATNGAVRCFEQLQGKAPDNLDVAASLAWARLKGKREPLQAQRDAAPLVAAAEQGQPMTAFQWQVLGAVHLANDRRDDAIRDLEKARRVSKTSAGVHVHLALAYHAQGRKEESRAALELARSLPRSPQEQADYLDAFAILQREKS